MFYFLSYWCPIFFEEDYQKIIPEKREKFFPDGRLTIRINKKY